MWNRYIAVCLVGYLGLGHAQQAARPPLPAPEARVPVLSVGTGHFEVPLQTVKQARVSRTLLQQYDFSCGSAAVATLLTHHYGTPVTEGEVFDQMYRTGDQLKIKREGFSLLDIKRYLQSRGFVADGFELPLDKLAEEKVPAIALITENGYFHFVVVKGLDAHRVLIGDPASGTRSMTRMAFEATWKNRLLFVIHNHMKEARFNAPEDWQAAPAAPLSAGILRDGLFNALPRNGPGQF